MNDGSQPHQPERGVRAEPAPEPELGQYLAVLFRHRRLLLLGTAGGLLVSVVLSLFQPRLYRAESLVVVSPAIVAATTSHSARAGQTETVPPGAELAVPALAVQTYQVLATSDELMNALADSLIHRLAGTDPELLADLAGPEPSVEALGYHLSGSLTAELVKQTEDAKSPLLAFRYTSTSKRLPVLVVNTWGELFLKRHQGLSSNVTEDFYQRVQAQFQVARDSLELHERRLTDLRAGYQVLKAARNEMDLKNVKLDSSLQAYQQVQAQIQDKQRQLAHTEALLRGLEHEGRWVGYLSRQEVLALAPVADAPPMRADLVRLVRQIAQLELDSTRVVQDSELRRQTATAVMTQRELRFEQERGAARLQAQADQLDSALVRYRAEIASIEERSAELAARLAAARDELDRQPPVLVLAKAVTDGALWDRVASGTKVDPGAQKGLSAYRLQSEEPNPIHERLAAQVSDLEVLLATQQRRAQFLKGELPRLQGELLRVQQELEPLRAEAISLRHELEDQRSELERGIRRAEEPVMGALARSRSTLADYLAYYVQAKNRYEQLRSELNGLRQEVALLGTSVLSWEDDLRSLAATVDSLDLEGKRLERTVEVYQETYERFARLQEQARIAREQAAGDIQVVSRATLVRGVPRGRVTSAGVGALAGLFLSALAAFAADYVDRYRTAVRAAS